MPTPGERRQKQRKWQSVHVHRVPRGYVYKTHCSSRVCVCAYVHSLLTETDSNTNLMDVSILFCTFCSEKKNIFWCRRRLLWRKNKATENHWNHFTSPNVQFTFVRHTQRPMCMRNRFVFLCWNSLWRLVSCGYRFIFISFFCSFLFCFVWNRFHRFARMSLSSPIVGKFPCAKWQCFASLCFNGSGSPNTAFATFVVYTISSLSLSLCVASMEFEAGETELWWTQKMRNRKNNEPRENEREREEQEMLIYLLFVYAIDSQRARAITINAVDEDEVQKKNAPFLSSPDRAASVFTKNAKLRGTSLICAG